MGAGATLSGTAGAAKQDPKAEVMYAILFNTGLHSIDLPLFWG
jgi:hypothetical protein